MMNKQNIIHYGKHIDEVASRQIKICRVLCIFFMMSVHVNPGLSQTSIISSGDLKFIGEIWVNFLGRASVATLSFISGYLLIKTGSQKNWKATAVDRFNVLIVPMIMWNMLFILLLFCKSIFLSIPEQDFPAQSIGDWLAYLSGINGPMANLSLFFLRDMFVAILLIKIGIELIARWQLLVVGVILCAGVFDALEPLIFRPSILFFATTGAIFAIRGGDMANFRINKFILLVFSFLMVLYLIISLLETQNSWQNEFQNLLKRSVLVFSILSISRWAARKPVGFWVSRFESDIYITYLSHAPLFGVMWVLWLYMGGNPHHPTYVVFFFVAPIMAIMLGQGLGFLMDISPGWVQKTLRGKIKNIDIQKVRDRPSSSV